MNAHKALGALECADQALSTARSYLTGEARERLRLIAVDLYRVRKHIEDVDLLTGHVPVALRTLIRKPPTETTVAPPLREMTVDEWTAEERELCLQARKNAAARSLVRKQPTTETAVCLRCEKTLPSEDAKFVRWPSGVSERSCPSCALELVKEGAEVVS